MRKFIRLLLPLILSLALLAGLSVSAFALGDLEYEFAFAVHSISDDSYVRHVGTDTCRDTLQDNEYYVIYMTIHNHSGKTMEISRATLSIDSDSYTWQDLRVNSAYSLRLGRDSMQRISAGPHRCTLTLDGRTVYDESFLMPREWGSLMRLPTAAEKQARTGNLRSPYMVYYVDFATSGGFEEYSIDLHTDHQPTGTYICPMSWWMDLSALEGSYSRVWADFGSTGGGYCGLQVWNDGTKGVIMTLWDVFCQEPGGGVKQIKAKVVYPENASDTDHNNSSEGSFVHYSYPYDWEAGKDYRMLLQQSVGDNGNVFLTLWIRDLSQAGWTRLFCFDTGLQGIWISSISGFLEDFDTRTAAEVRSMEVWNIRAHMRKTGQWENARSVSFLVNGSVSISDYKGSCQFGQDSRSCWMLTSGVEGLCRTNGSTGPYPVPATEKGRPY